MHENNSYKTVFLGTADNAVQNQEVDHKNISLEINILIILGYTPILAAPFIWQSAETMEAITKYRDLLYANKGLKLIGKEGVNTIDQYFRMREEETKNIKKLTLSNDSPFILEIPGATTIDWKHSLSPEIVLKKRPKSVENWFRNLFIKDLESFNDQFSIWNTNSRILNATYSNIGRRKAEYMLHKLSESVMSEHFSRAVIESCYLTENHYGGLRSIQTRASSLYQAANSIANNSSLFTTNNILKYLPKSLNIEAFGNKTISPKNPYMFADTLSILGLKKCAWSNLDCLDIIRTIDTINPLSIFSVIYKSFVIDKIIHCKKRGLVPSYDIFVKNLQRDLFANNDWEFLEKLIRINLNFPLAIFSALGAYQLGYNPITIASATRQAFGYLSDIVSNFSFIEILKLRKSLKNYLREIKLLY